MECARALLDALYGSVARKRGLFRDADGGVEGFRVAGPDCGGCEVGETGELSERVKVWWAVGDIGDVVGMLFSNRRAGT